MKPVKPINPQLSERQKEILFKKGTEPPFTGKLLTEKRKGLYYCANCSAPLFDSTAKYESMSGWPSFTQALEGKVVEESDTTHGLERIEVACKNCSAHLGHVFEEGPQEKGRILYCINSASMGFKSKKERE
jgi:peptide-methionine (R)-S-oxide reductase